MEENKVAKYIKIIGILIIVLGVIGSFVLGDIYAVVETYGTTFTFTEETYNWPVTLIGIFSSMVSGILFIGFSEVINLLQKTVTQLRIVEEITISKKQ